MTGRFRVRAAAVDDIPALAHHRAMMFHDMGDLPADQITALEETTTAYLREAMPRAEYLAWIASPVEEPSRVVAGAGVQIRRVLPFPAKGPTPFRIAPGRQAIVLNVYTERAWRRLGLARLLMAQVLDWARAARLDSLILHASSEGRALYLDLGFAPTNEMRYGSDLTT